MQHHIRNSYSRMKTSVSPPATHDLTPSWELVRTSIDLLKQNFEAVTFLILLPALLLDLGVLLFGHYALFQHQGMLPRQKFGLVIMAIGFIWSLINLGPSIYFQTRIVRDKAETVGNYYRHGFAFTRRLIAYNILYFLTVLGGLILLIVPGVIAMRRYYLAGFYLVDQNISVREAMKKAAEDTKPVSGFIWGIIGVQVVFSLIAAALSTLLLIGIVLEAIVVYVCLFLPALRYQEIQPARRKK